MSRFSHSHQLNFDILQLVGKEIPVPPIRVQPRTVPRGSLALTTNIFSYVVVVRERFVQHDIVKR